MLYLIGTGLSADDISMKAVSVLKKCFRIYLDTYTSYFSEGDIKKIEKYINKKIIPLKREDIESDFLIKEAKRRKISLLVIGDPFSATTHMQLILDAEKEKVEYEIIHGVSCITAVCETGLHVYKFGRIISIPTFHEGFKPFSFFDNFLDNYKLGLHTLFLLDLDMNIKSALNTLLEISSFKNNEINKKILVLAIARLSAKDKIIKYGTIEELSKIDFGKPPYLLIIPGKMHFSEEEAINRYKI